MDAAFQWSGARAYIIKSPLVVGHAESVSFQPVGARGLEGQYLLRNSMTLEDVAVAEVFSGETKLARTVALQKAHSS